MVLLQGFLFGLSCEQNSGLDRWVILGQAGGRNDEMLHDRRTEAY